MKLNSQTVQEELKKLGFGYEVIELSESTHTAVDAANALNCSIAQIAKSIIFKSESNNPILIIASGINRVDEKIIEEEIGERVGRADVDFVLEKTGFVIGGVPPIGHISSIQTFIDNDLLQYEDIWAAAGNPRAVFKLKSKDLIEMVKGKFINLK
ncbi:MAG: YbaK/EbsC family protein [Patescibacteria group bacterium]